MGGDHKRKRSHSQDELDHEHKRSASITSLRTKIDELLNRLPKCSTSKGLMNGFIEHVWPEIRNDYSKMTLYLDEELKKVLKEENIDAEVFSRVKDDVSITKTLIRREKGLIEHGESGFNSYHRIFREMHDLSGLRIVLENGEDCEKTQELVEELFKRQDPPTHFAPNREIGQFWKKPWFGAYETQNHRVQLADDNKAALGAGHQYSGVTFEIQLTTYADNLYNKLAHTLLYKADPGLLTWQEEMVVDMSHGLTKCFALCMKILRPKLHRDTDKRTDDAEERVGRHEEEKAKLAQSAVDDFEEHLRNQPATDRTAQLLRKLLSKDEDAADQECLKDLRVSDPHRDKERIEETKGGLLRRSYDWILQDHDFQQWQKDGRRQPFWITGDPGKGKTMMLCGIINELDAQSGINVSYFFCQGTDQRINTGAAVLRGLLFLLCNQQHSLIRHIRREYDTAGVELFEDTNAWFTLSEIFNNVLRDSGLRQTYLVVDALDECLEESRRLLVEFIARMSSAHQNVRWIVSSRELVEFKTHLRKASHLSLESESRKKPVSAAVMAYIDFKVDMLGDQIFSHATVEEIKPELKRKSEGTFLWVAIVCKELESAQEHNVRRILERMPKGLDKLYGKLVDDINALDFDDPENCKSVLRAASVAFRPLTLEEIQELADLPKHVPADAITKMCRSFLTVRDGTVFFVHQSARDYLWDEWNTVFDHSIRQTHESMFSNSVKAMDRILDQDIYKLGHPGISIEDIQQPSQDPLVSIRYSSVCWITHFRGAQPCSLENAVDGFLSLHFLHWLEALSLIRSASASVYALRDLVTLSSTKGGRFEQIANDMYRFARSYWAIIETAPLQAYSSALIFSPAHSLTRNLFAQPDWIVRTPKVEEYWNSCLATLTGHSGPVHSVAFSPEGHHIVSGSSDSIIKVWDAESGAVTFKLHGHRGRVWSVAFNGGSKIMTSRSDDGTARTWNVETGACISTCEDSSDPVETLAVSLDERRHATRFSTSDIRITDKVSNTEVLTLQGHSKPIRSVAFSPDNRYITSGSDDQTVKVWNAKTGKLISTLQGHEGAVSSVCFSPDVCRIASGSEDGTIKIWDVESSSGTSTLQDHHAHRGAVNSVALTLDGRRVASGSLDRTVKILDIEPYRTVERKFDSVILSITFSPDERYIAASNIMDIVVMDTERLDPTSTCTFMSVGPIALSLEGHYVAELVGDTPMIKDMENVEDRPMPLSGHEGNVTSLAFSPRDCHIAASASLDMTIKIWNVETGAQISTLDVGQHSRLLRFDSTGVYLHTNSSLRFRDSTWSSNSTAPQTELVLPELRQDGHGLDVDGSWITCHGQKILWLPLEFRGNRIGSRSDSRRWRPSDVLPHMISIGCSSGRVWWVTFSPEHYPVAL